VNSIQVTKLESVRCPERVGICLFLRGAKCHSFVRQLMGRDEAVERVSLV
jgi:hypothetical protein